MSETFIEEESGLTPMFPALLETLNQCTATPGTWNSRNEGLSMLVNDNRL